MIGYVKFEGGPLDQYVYATEVLLGDKGLQLPVFEYLWTSEKVTSDKTGAVAQVWKHRSLVTGVPDRPDPATVAALATSGPRGATTTAAPSQPAAAAPTPPVAPTPQPAAPAASVEAPEADNVSPITVVPNGEDVGVNGASAPGADGPSLIDRRKALRLSRKDVADATGLAISKIIAIETDTGKRVKPEERFTLVEFIATREGQVQPASAHA